MSDATTAGAGTVTPSSAEPAVSSVVPTASSGAVGATGSEQPDADRIAETVLGLRDVVRLSGGQFGEVATYLPGRRVTGVQVTDDQVSVHVVARYGPPLHELSAQIHRALTSVVPGYPVEVAFDDVERD